MQLAIIFVSLCVATVLSETCRQTSDCHWESCSGDGWTMNCHSGQCTCDNGVHTGNTCTAASDCSGMTCPPLLSGHCTDGHCRCTFGLGGGIGGGGIGK